MGPEPLPAQDSAPAHTLQFSRTCRNKNGTITACAPRSHTASASTAATSGRSKNTWPRFVPSSSFFSLIGSVIFPDPSPGCYLGGQQRGLPLGVSGSCSPHLRSPLASKSASGRQGTIQHCPHSLWYWGGDCTSWDSLCNLYKCLPTLLSTGN